jgi:hypothetical protein
MSFVETDLGNFAYDEPHVSLIAKGAGIYMLERGYKIGPAAWDEVPPGSA